MEQAASHGDGGAGISGEPWEQVVRQIPLAARGDVLDDMASVWDSYVHNLNSFAERFDKIWDDCLEGRWTGDAADACAHQWHTSAQSIAKIADNYQQVPGLLRHCSASIHEAISSIPIPVFQGGDLPGNLSRGDSGGDGLYQDYQGNRAAYGDYEFLHKALDADSDSYANGVRTRHDGSYRTDLTSADERNAITDQDDQVRTAAIKRWYAGHQATAHNAREQLLNDYSHTHAKLPGSTADANMPVHSRGSEPDHSRSSSDGGPKTHVSASGGGAPSVGGLPATAYGSGGSSASLPPTGAPHEFLGPPQVSHPSGFSTDPGSALAGSSDLYSPDHQTGLPSAVIGSYGPSSGGSGGAAVGSGGGGWTGSGVGVPGTTAAPQEGWWNSRPGSAPMGPRVSPPGSLESTPGPSGRPGTGPTSGMGMMPHGNAGGKAGESEEYQTWLTEDDDDIWGTRRNDITTGWIE